MSNGDSGEVVFFSHIEGLLRSIGAKSLEDGLDGDTFYLFIVFKVGADFLQCWETGAVAAGAPRLKTVKVDDFSF